LLDLTQEELADRVGCSPVTIRKLESDERRASKQLAERLAQFLAIPPAELDHFLRYARTTTHSPAAEMPAPPPPLPVPAAVVSSAHVDWGEAPDAALFHGRSAELAQLHEWLLVSRCRVIALLGMGGIGKSSLAIEAARTHQNDFEVIIWRSLRTAPPVEEIVDEFLRTLIPGTILDSVPQIERQIRRLLEQMRGRRCLLILDNAESILAEGEHAGTYRPGYAGYGELLRRLGESSHQSCLLVTSREMPAEVSLLIGMGMPVRSLTLSSLSAGASRTLLAHRGLSGTSESWRALIESYSGNPLLLQVVGETIRELFQGSIDRFLQFETPLVGSVRELLAGQFARLTSFEQELLIWLAIHCSPVEADVLHDEMRFAPGWALNRATMLDTLHSLRRRSLVEQGERGFMLQNVVMEFVTDYLVEQVVEEISTRQHLYLDRYALLNAQERHYVRESQTRLLLKPVVERLVALFGKGGADNRLQEMLTTLRKAEARHSGYSAGNILNLLVHLNGHLRDQDFSGLVVRRANLQGIDAQGANFCSAHLDQCEFSIAFRGVTTVKFSPAGDYFAIGSETGLYCLRRMQEDFPLHRQMSPSGGIWRASFSPDGSQVAAAGTEHAIRIWLTASGRLLHALTGHAGIVWTLCHSPDGKLLASGGADSSVRLWDTQSGESLAKLLEHTQDVRGLCFSPSSDLLASASDDGTVRLWALAALPAEIACVRVLRGHKGAVMAVAFSPDGSLLATGGADRSIRLWDAQTGQLLLAFDGHTNYVTQLCFHPHASLLASSSYDGTARIWDIRSAQCLCTLQGHSSRIWGIAFSPDGRVLASGSADQSVRLWELEDGTGARCIKILRGFANSIRTVTYSPDGAIVASGGQDMQVRLWEASTGRCLATLSGHRGSIWDVRFSPDGKRLVSAGHESYIRIWDVAGGRCVQELEQAGGCDTTSFHPSGTIIATANLDHTISLWDAQSWQLLATLTGHTDEVWAAAFSPDGNLVASGGMDSTVRLWDWRSGRCLCTFHGHTSFIRIVSFSPDGTLLASSSLDSTVRLWDVSHVATSQPATNALAVLNGPAHTAQTHVAISPDGTLLAAAGADGLVSLWEMSEALKGAPPLRVLEGHAGRLYCLSFRHDSRRLASSGDDGTIRLWNIEDVQRGVACEQILQVERPYARMNIGGATGLTQAQIASLQVLGATEEGALIRK
jgi:WD40 repeat protein/DNA-binding XRE family transcriptional regulator